MNPQALGLRVAGIIFGLMTLVQFMRVLIRPEVTLAGHRMPLWPSAIAVVILGCLSFWMLKLSKNPKQ